MPQADGGILGQKSARLVRVPTPLSTKVHWVMFQYYTYLPASGREVSTGRQVAIKKIKVGQFKDGLDMSAIREVKYLHELKHQNVIEVRASFPLFSACDLLFDLAPRRLFFENKPQSSARVPRHRSRAGHQGSFTCVSPCRYQKLDGYDVPRFGVLPPELDSTQSACPLQPLC